jgi:hypothetical protein
LPGRTPRAAIEDFVTPRRELLRCLTDRGFVPSGSQPGEIHVVFFHGNLASLGRRRDLDPLRFKVSLDYVIEPSADRAGWWDARMVGWIYEISTSADRPILDFHWHPNSGRVTWPHLHAYGANDAVELHKLHPPTGPVTASSVVRFLIEDLDVAPRRQDWEAVLDRHATI